MKILVCGGRDYKNRRYLYNCLDLYLGYVTEIAQGGANGADRLTKAWAKSRSINCKEYTADWNTHGKAAGPIRNQFMLDDFKPDIVLAFSGGKGTAHMVKIARAAGIRAINLPDGDFNI